MNTNKSNTTTTRLRVLVNASKKSSAIKEATYDSSTQELNVTFSSGSKIIHEGVSERDAENFARAESAGKFYNKNIRDRFDYTVVE